MAVMEQLSREPPFRLGGLSYMKEPSDVPNVPGSELAA
jgi:hypothetical protein